MSINSAGSQIDQIQQTALSYQTDIYHSVRAGLDSLLSGSIIDAPSVSIPGSPDGVSLPSIPSPPSIDVATTSSPTAPTAPVLETATVGDVDVPTFSESAPSLVFPSFDDIEFPASPGEAPDLGEIAIPADPGVVLPDVPALDAVDIPEMPSFIMPQFQGESPFLPDITTPGQIFAHQDSAFSSPVWDALQDKLLDDLINGGDVTAILETAGVFEQQSRWVIDERERKKEEVRASYSAMGYSRLPGPALAQIRLVELDAEKSLEGLLNTITAKKAELTIQNRQFAIQQSLAAVTGVVLDVWNQGNNRALEAAKEAAATAFRDLDARVSLFNARVAAFQAEAAVFEARIRAALGTLEAYKTAMQGAQIRGELRKQDVDLYLARLQGVTQVIEVYKARMSAAQVAADIQKTRIQAYEARVQAFSGEVNAVTAQYNARVAQITGEKAKAEVFSEQVKAFSERVTAAKTRADIDVARANVVTQRNQSVLGLYQADVEAFKAKWTGMLGQAEVVQKNAQTVLSAYDTNVRGITADMDARIRTMAANVQLWTARLDATIREATLHLDWGKTKADVNERAAATAAQVAGQAFAATSSMIHGSVSLGSSYSDSVSDATSTSTSTVQSSTDSTSHSNSYSEVYSYSKSL